MKSKNTTAILALFLGGIGIHRFYLGQIWKGIASVIFCLSFIPLLIGIIDFFVFLVMNNETFDNKYNNGIVHKLKVSTNVNVKSCALCTTELNLLNTPSFGSGKLKDGGVLCTKCFRKINNIDPSIAFKLKKYDLVDIENLVEEQEKKNKQKLEIKDRPLPRTESKMYNVPKDDIIESIILPDDIEILKLNSLAQISYTDNAGQRSERRITMKAIQQTYDNDYLITAYCHEKQAERSFKLSRISKFVDLETGEIFPDPRKYFLERFNNSPLGLISKCFQEYESEILVLAFMARADGVLRKKERDIIVDYIQSKRSSTLDSNLLDVEIKRTYCDSSDFRKSLRSIKSKSDIEKLQIFECATGIVNSDKKTDPVELGILELMKTEFKLEKAST